MQTIGAGDRIRTYDLRITNALLYQLSYTGYPNSRMGFYLLICRIDNGWCDHQIDSQQDHQPSNRERKGVLVLSSHFRRPKTCTNHI